MTTVIDQLLQEIRRRYEELGPSPTKREAFLAHLRSLARWDKVRAQLPDPGPVEFPSMLHVAFAVCQPDCGCKEFIVDGSTQECQHCGSLMFRTDTKEYTLSG